MTKKQQIKFGIISGLGLIIVYLVLSLFAFECPTENQYVALRIIISMGAAAFATAIPGFIEVKYSNLITASGAIAVFVIILMVNPKPISSFSDCNTETRINGNVFLNNKPFEMAEVYLIELDSRKLYTNDNGNFSFSHQGKIEQDQLTVRIKSSALNIDTSITVKDYLSMMKFNLFYSSKENNVPRDTSIAPTPDIVQKAPIDSKKPAEVLKEYCVECMATDSLGKIVNVKNRCNADSLYLVNYIEGFTRASKEQSRTANCSWKK
jgi:hypothetical protein